MKKINNWKNFLCSVEFCIHVDSLMDSLTQNSYNHTKNMQNFTQISANVTARLGANEFRATNNNTNNNNLILWNEIKIYEFMYA